MLWMMAAAFVIYTIVGILARYARKHPSSQSVPTTSPTDVGAQAHPAPGGDH
jgi:hypothetical protein